MARETMKSRAVQVLAAALTLMMLAGSAVPQQSTTPQAPNPSTMDKTDPFGTRSQDDKDRMDMPHDMQHQLALARQTERQKRIVADSDRLLLLATQLHNDVAKTDKDILSVDVIKRADEIEKLARSVKEHMKG